MTVESAPDLSSPVLAWRAWTVVPRDEHFRLASVITQTVWQPGVALEAECLRIGWRWPRRTHGSPNARCECGIYGADRGTAVTYAEREPDLTDCGGVIGRVALWGTVLECEHGWRAEYAYPWDIIIPEHTWRTEGQYALEDVALDLMDYGGSIRLVDTDEWVELTAAAA